MDARRRRWRAFRWLERGIVLARAAIVCFYAAILVGFILIHSIMPGSPYQDLAVAIWMWINVAVFTAGLAVWCVGLVRLRGVSEGPERRLLTGALVYLLTVPATGLIWLGGLNARNVLMSVAVSAALFSAGEVMTAWAVRGGEPSPPRPPLRMFRERKVLIMACVVLVLGDAPLVYALACLPDAASQGGVCALSLILIILPGSLLPLSELRDLVRVRTLAFAPDRGGGAR